MIRIIIVADRFLLYDIDISKSGGDTMEVSKLTQKTMFRLLPVQILLASASVGHGFFPHKRRSPLRSPVFLPGISWESRRCLLWGFIHR